MGIEEKYSKELLDYIKEWASDAWDTGHPMDRDDIDEFCIILKDDSFDVGFDEAQELFDYYFEEFDRCREEWYNDEHDRYEDYINNNHD